MTKLSTDHADVEQLVSEFAAYAKRFLSTQDDRSAVGVGAGFAQETSGQIRNGIGASKAFDEFDRLFSKYLNGSSGPNYYGYVTGGSTPAALIGDWLTALFDQNAMGSDDSVAPTIELQAVNMFCELIGLPLGFSGSFVTGATMSSFVGLSAAKQWASKQQGIDAAYSGMYGLKPISVLSASPHSSIYKAMSMSGLGREHLIKVSTLENREAMSVRALDGALDQLHQPAIVVANAGTVNTVDFDDLSAIAQLKKKHNFWLHVDAAFGGIAACSGKYRHFLNGLEHADSITIDAHKWLNVPYDCAIQLTKHLDYQRAIFQNSASYLSDAVSDTNFVDLTPENSRRLRALPVWFTLMAYGIDGYAEMVERTVVCAQEFGCLIDQDPAFVLLAPVTLNGVCFTLNDAVNKDDLQRRVAALIKAIHNDGEFFLTGTHYRGKPAIRLSVSNWQTQSEHVRQCYRKLKNLNARH